MLKKLLAFSGLIILIALYTPGYSDSLNFMGEKLNYDQVYQEDVDGNGQQELTFYMKGDQLVLSEWDIDGNGIPDHFFSYGEDDILAYEALDKDGDGQPEQFYKVGVDDTEERVPYESPQNYMWFVGGFGILAVAVFGYMLTRKGNAGKSTTAMLLVTVLVLISAVPSNAAEILNDDCIINESVFQKDWIKYSDIDERIGSESRSFESQNVQKNADELRIQYAGLVLAERDLALEREKRKDLKEIKGLLIRNVKNNLLKAFMRLTYVTYDTIKGAYGNKGSVEAILDKSTAGVQVLTSYIKMRASLEKPSVSESQKKTVSDRMKGISNSTLIEYFDTAGDPGKVAGNLVNDLQKELFDVVSTEDQWDDAKLSEADFQLLRDQYLRNRGMDVAIQASYLKSSDIRRQRDGYLEAIERLEAEYRQGMANERERVRSILIEDCRRQAQSSGEEVSEEEPSEIQEPEDRDTDSDLWAGQWSGSMQIQKIHQPEKYSANEQSAIMSKNQTMTFVISLADNGAYSVTDTQGRLNPMTVTAKSIDIQFNEPIPNGAGTLYQKLSGTLSADGNRIAGTFVIGMDKEGDAFSGIWQAARQ